VSHCNTPQRTATHCIALQRTATHCTALHCIALHRTASHCTALQHTAPHCIALHRTVLHCIALQCTASPCNALQRVATHCNTLQRTTILCNTGVLTFLDRCLFSAVNSEDYLSLRQLAESQEKISAKMAGDAIHAICALRARAATYHARERGLEVKIKQFPMNLSTRNFCIIGKMHTKRLSV